MIFRNDIETVLDLIKMKQLNIKINLSAEPFIISAQKKMSKIYGNIIDPKYFQFTIRGKSSFRYGNEMNCHIVWNIIGSNDYNYCRLYCLRIFGPDDCPIPIQFDNVKPTKIIEFVYYNKFKVSQFIDDVFNSIKSSQDHPLMDDKIKELYELYFNAENINDEEEDDVDMKESMMINEINPMLSMVNTRKSKDWYSSTTKCKLQTMTLFKGCQQFDSSMSYNGDYFVRADKVINLNLYMMRMTPSDISKDIKVNIEFVADEQRIGIPYYIWIHKDDTLKNIINQHFKELKDHLKQVW